MVWTRPQVVAHRGASAHNAEHTLGAYVAALDEGAEALECDVRLTADGYLVCVHDRDLRRTAHRDGIVSAMELADLEDLDFSAWKHPWADLDDEAPDTDPELAKDLGYAKLPEFEPGTPARATLGGMNYAISAYSKHPQEAFDAAMCLRTPESQLQVAIEGGEPPVAPSVYENPEFQKVYPMGPEMLEEMETAVPRPKTPVYQNISTLVSTTLSPPL